MCSYPQLLYYCRCSITVVCWVCRSCYYSSCFFLLVMHPSVGVLHLSCHLSTPDHVRRPLSLFQMPCIYHHQSFRPSALLLHSGGNTWIPCDISLHFCSFSDGIFFQFAWLFYQWRFLFWCFWPFNFMSLIFISFLQLYVFLHYYCNIIVLCYISLHFHSFVNSIFFNDTCTFSRINFISLIFVLFLSVSAWIL